MAAVGIFADRVRLKVPKTKPPGNCYIVEISYRLADTRAVVGKAVFLKGTP